MGGVLNDRADEGSYGWMHVAHLYIDQYGNSAWSQIYADREAFANKYGYVDENLKNAEHFIYAYQIMSAQDGHGYAYIALLTYMWAAVKIFWIDYALVGFEGPVSHLTFQEIVAGLMGGYCYYYYCRSFH